MKKTLIIFLLSFCNNFYGQNITTNMKDVKYNFVTIKPFLLYDPSKKNLDYLKYFKATDPKTSLLVFYMFSKDSIKIVSGGKTINEDKFGNNSTSVRSISPVSNQKSIDIIFYKENAIEKVTLNPEDLKKYKFIYVSPKQSPLDVEFTNVWKMFM